MGAIEPHDHSDDEELPTTGTSDEDTTGHNTAVLQLGWDVVDERRRQAKLAVRDTRPHVQPGRGLLGRLRRRA